MEDLVIRETINSELKEDGTLVINVHKFMYKPISAITINMVINKDDYDNRI